MKAEAPALALVEYIAGLDKVFLFLSKADCWEVLDRNLFLLHLANKADFR